VVQSAICGGILPLTLSLESFGHCSARLALLDLEFLTTGLVIVEREELGWLLAALLAPLFLQDTEDCPQDTEDCP
jgi:hypothetical protein